MADLPLFSDKELHAYIQKARYEKIYARTCDYVTLALTTHIKNAAENRLTKNGKKRVAEKQLELQKSGALAIYKKRIPETADAIGQAIAHMSTDDDYRFNAKPFRDLSDAEIDNAVKQAVQTAVEQRQQELERLNGADKSRPKSLGEIAQEENIQALADEGIKHLRANPEEIQLMRGKIRMDGKTLAFDTLTPTLVTPGAETTVALPLAPLVTPAIAPAAPSERGAQR